MSGNNESKKKYSPADYETDSSANLCPGCGHALITRALRQAVSELNLPPEKLNVVAGIGCSGKTVAEIKANGIHTLHGCPAPVAMGSQVTNPDQEHVLISGDGDSWAIGSGKMIALLRTNLNLLYICENNGTYGLTRGQLSPTTKIDSPTRWGMVSDIPPVDGIGIAMVSGATYVARGFSARQELLVEQIKGGILHDGLAYLEVFSPCRTFNDHEGSHHSYKYCQQHARDFPKISVDDIEADYPSDSELEHSFTYEEEGQQFGLEFDNLDEMPDYDPTDLNLALKTWEDYWTEQIIPLGLLYIDDSQRAHHERFYSDEDDYIATLEPEETRPSREDFSIILDQFR